jgi:membrane protease YdiL (CAAX protease family)
LKISQDSPIVFGPKAFHPLLSLAVFVGMLALGAIALVASLVILLFSHGFDTVATQHALLSMPGIEAQAATEAVVVVFLLLVLPPLAGTTLAGLGFRKVRAQSVAVALAGAAAMFVVTIAVGSALATLLHVKTNEAAIQVFMHLTGAAQKAGFALFAVVIAAFVEELVFRIFLFNAIRRWTSFWPAAIASSLLFGLAHIQSAVPAQIVALSVPLACAGVILCAVYARTNNAWMSMITHGTFNAISLLLLLVAPKLAQ